MDPEHPKHPEHRDGTKDEETDAGKAARAGEAGAAPDEEQKPDACPEAADGPAPSGTDEGREPDECRSLKGKLKRKDHEIKDLRKEVHDLKDKYLRLAAEMDNQRKRLDREKGEFHQFALADVLKEMLGVLDNFERALKSLAETESPAVLEGIALIAKQYVELLRKRGVAEIEAEGKPFDPTVHAAILSEEKEDVPEPVVGEVFQKGYRLNDRLLRPALVKVLVPGRS